MTVSLRRGVQIGFALFLAMGTLAFAATSTHRLQPNQTHVFYAYVTAGVQTSIYVDGDDDTDLDLEVYGAPGSMVVGDHRPWVDASVQWTPSRTGFVQVKVINLGDVWNEYTIRATGGDLQ